MDLCFLLGSCFTPPGEHQPSIRQLNPGKHGGAHYSVSVCQQQDTVRLLDTTRCQQRTDGSVTESLPTFIIQILDGGQKVWEDV